MGKILIDDLNDTEELNQATGRSVRGGRYLSSNPGPPPAGGPIPVPYPNTGLIGNTGELAKGGSLPTERADIPMQPMIAYW